MRVLDTATGAQVAIIDPNSSHGPPPGWQPSRRKWPRFEWKVRQRTKGSSPRKNRWRLQKPTPANARAAAESQAKVQADKVAQLAAAEQRLAAIAAEKASLEQSAVVTIEQLVRRSRNLSPSSRGPLPCGGEARGSPVGRGEAARSRRGDRRPA